MKYPKVLIIGNTLNKRTGIGITLSNLFEGWPSEKLAIATQGDINKIYTNQAKQFYCFGDKETKVMWPLKYFININKSKACDFNLHNEEMSQINSGFLKVLKQIMYENIVKKLLILTGLYFIRYNLCPSQKFTKWVKTFNPDIIYCASSNLHIYTFIKRLLCEYDCKLIIHVADDWANSNYNLTIYPLKLYWEKRFKTVFEHIVMCSSVRLAISEKMAKEYSKKYRKIFLPYHNPVKLENWEFVNQKTRTDRKEFKILYIGKVNKDTCEGINCLITAVSRLNEKFITFHVYSNTSRIQLKKKMRYYETHYRGSIEHNNIPVLFQDYDALFLPLSFDKRSIQYTRLSMPTKLTEYMVSEKPILLYAPSELAVTEYLKENGCAFIIEEKAKFNEGLNEFLSNSELRQVISKKAKMVAVKNHESKIVKKAFLNNINIVVN